MSGLRERKHLVLLLVLVLGLAIQPLAPGHLLGLVVYDLTLALIVLAVFLIAFQRGWELGIALGAGLPALVSNEAAHALWGGPRLAG
jgi:hypothetical protein